MGKGRTTFRKVITSPELIEQINPKNKDLMKKFLKNFATKRSPKSVVVYESNLNIFMCWNVLENDNKFFIDIKKYELLEFFDYCSTELQWSPNRYAQMHSCLSSFSNFIETFFDEKYENFRNVMSKIEKPAKEAVRQKSVFTKEDMDGLMDWLGEKNRIQEQCLLATMLSSGARASELVRFTTTMIDEENTAFEDIFLETTEEMQVKGRGVHGKKILRYLIKDTFLPYYKKWLPLREQIMKENNIEHDYIFIKRNGEPASVSTIRGWIEKWDNVLDKHFYIHNTRHYWCSSLLKANVPAELIQELQDWSTTEMVTKVYNDNTAKDRKWKLDKLKDALDSGAI